MAFTDELRNSSIGGIPVWGIGLGLAGVVLIVVAIKKRATPPPSTETPDNAFVGSASNVDQGTVGPLNPVDQFLANDPTNPAYPVGLTAQGLPGPITNAQWGRLSFDFLVGKGDDPTLVENAISKYLGGQPLSAQEEAVKNTAQETFGAPPEGLIQTTVIASNVTNNGTSVASSPPPAPRTGPTLQQGSRGPSVVLLQQLLNSHGAGLVVDGQFGPLTAQAVRNFQKNAAIDVDGIVGPITWSKL